MKRWIPLISSLAAACLGATLAYGQGASPHSGTVIVPGTNIERPSDVGQRSHTDYLIFRRQHKNAPTGPQGETPGSIACIYQTASSLTTGCPIATATSLPSGGSGIIAVVDAYDYPSAASDFDTFSSTFGLPHGATACNGGPCFSKVYATGSAPKPNAGWALEAALDIEWAHAMAPSAQIVLVEAASNSNSDLLDAVDAASDIVSTCNHTCSAGSGTGEVSMSWGDSEFSQEDTLDAHFSTPGVIYTAASGDVGGSPIWPSTSPNVLSAGGTTVNRAADGTFSGETAWTDSGGGPSAFEPRPGYQDVIVDTVGAQRGTPDLSFDSDPASGVSVYDTTRYQGQSGWFVIGGTSAAAQGLAGLINLVATSTSSTSDELTTIYGNFTNPSDFTDITAGQTSGCHGNGHHVSSTCFSAVTGWDFMTGVGTNLGKSGK